jgi:hypothetical protein
MTNLSILVSCFAVSYARLRSVARPRRQTSVRGEPRSDSGMQKEELPRCRYSRARTPCVERLSGCAPR